MPIDFSARYSDYARFLPAVSEMYTRFVVNATPKRPSPVPQSDLDFLNPNTNLWYLPCALYSAGQAAKTSGAAKRKDMITGRTNPNSIILGDSGGFQIQQGSIKFKGDETRNRMMSWLEDNCEWSMILDFPTGGINMGTIDAHYNRLMQPGADAIQNADGTITTLSDFVAQNGFDMSDMQVRGFVTCMFQTLVNNDYFIKHRSPGKTKFLNVVQGRNVEESNVWYDKVKHYDFEGWSLAGPHKEKFDMTMTRLLSMRRDGLLENKNWMHILGVGKLANGCAYTTIQRQIRKHDNPEFTISYDVSSPFTSAAYGTVFIGYTLDKEGWIIHNKKNVDGRRYLKSYNPDNEADAETYLDENRNLVVYPYQGNTLLVDQLRQYWENDLPHADRTQARFVETEISKRIRMSEICVNSDPNLTSTWDVVTYAMMMNHNAQVHLEAVFDAQDLYDKGDIERVPHDMLELKDLIEEILDPNTKDPYAIIERHRKTLNCLAGDKVESGIITHNAFDVAPIKEHSNFVNTMKAHINSLRSDEPSEFHDIFA